MVNTLSLPNHTTHSQHLPYTRPAGMYGGGQGFIGRRGAPQFVYHDQLPLVRGMRFQRGWRCAVQTRGVKTLSYAQPQTAHSCGGYMWPRPLTRAGGAAHLDLHVTFKGRECWKHDRLELWVVLRRHDRRRRLSKPPPQPFNPSAGTFGGGQGPDWAARRTLMSI